MAKVIVSGTLGYSPLPMPLAFPSAPPYPHAPIKLPSTPPPLPPRESSTNGPQLQEETPALAFPSWRTLGGRWDLHCHYEQGGSLKSEAV